MHHSTANPSAYTSVGSSQSARRQSLRNSIVKVKEMPQQDFYTKRLSKIKDIFQKTGHDINAVLCETDLLELLDSFGKAPFDRDVALQLFERIPFTQDPGHPGERFYSLQDFVDTHITAEYLLLMQADETESELNKVNHQLQHIKGTWNSQQSDPYAAEELNSLQVDIEEIACDDPHYTPAKGNPFSVIVVFNQYKYETDEVEANGQDFNLHFHRSFHLKVKNPQETIKILLRDFDQYSSNPEYRELKCTLLLDRFEDQEVHNEWFYLYDSENRVTKFKVHAKIQWQYSNSSVYQEAVHTLNEVQVKLLDNKEAIESSLKALVRPFLKAAASPNRNRMSASLPTKNNEMRSSNYM